MPSLKPIRLRGVACSRLVDDVRPNPSCDQRIVAEPRAMRARLRTAWNATCGSSAQACTQRSPPLRRGVELVAAAARASSLQARAGASTPSPKRFVEQRRPEAEGDREPGGLEAERLAGVVGRRERLGVGRAGRLAARSSARRPPTSHAAARAGRASGATSKAREVEPVLRGRGDPGLVGAGERDDGRRRRGARRRRRPTRVAAGRRPATATAPAPAAPSSRAARQPRVAPQPASAAGRRACESGSASASTACESARTSLAVSAS